MLATGDGYIVKGDSLWRHVWQRLGQQGMIRLKEWMSYHESVQLESLLPQVSQQARHPSIRIQTRVQSKQGGFNCDGRWLPWLGPVRRKAQSSPPECRLLMRRAQL
jgi:hypothetical protein